MKPYRITKIIKENIGIQLNPDFCISLVTRNLMQKSRKCKKQGLVKLEIQNWYLTIDAKIRVNAIFDGAIIRVQLYIEFKDHN